MRVLTERLRDRKLDLLDGIKVLDRRGWSQVLPDPDEPVVHIYAEGKTRRAPTSSPTSCASSWTRSWRRPSRRQESQAEVDPSGAACIH